MSVTPISLSDGQATNCGWAVICDGCGMGLQFLLDDDPRAEIDTEVFGSSQAAARSAMNRGWELEPPDGRDGAYCPDCIEADAAGVRLKAKVFEDGQRARRQGKNLGDNPHYVRDVGAAWAKGWCDQDMVFLHEGEHGE